MILRRSFRVVSLLLVLLLLAGPLAATVRRSHETRQSRVSIAAFMSDARAYVSRIWEQAGNLIVPLGKAGSQTDPFGNPAPNSQPSSSSTSSDSSGK